MAELIQLVVSGVATGAIYALAALGFTLLWQASGTINFAQGEFVMLPAFAMLAGLIAGAPLWLAFLLACAASMLVLGWGFKRAIVDPLIRHGDHRGKAALRELGADRLDRGERVVVAEDGLHLHGRLRGARRAWRGPRAIVDSNTRVGAGATPRGVAREEGRDG